MSSENSGYFSVVTTRYTHGEKATSILVASPTLPSSHSSKSYDRSSCDNAVSCRQYQLEL